MLRTLRAADIVVDLGINVRLALDPATVAAYQESYAVLPPVEVYELPDGRLVLVDGFHRNAARQQLGYAQLQAEVVSGTWAEARERAIRANLEHGKPYTRAEKQRAAAEFLRLHPDWADNRIAQALAGTVSAPTVGVVRAKLEAAGELPPQERLCGADGKERPCQYQRREAAAPVDTQGRAEATPAARPGAVPCVPQQLGDSWAIYQQDIATWSARYDGEPFHVLLGNLDFPRPWSAASAARLAPFLQPATWQAIERHLYPGALVVLYVGCDYGNALAGLLRQAGLFLHPTIFALAAPQQWDVAAELLSWARTGEYPRLPCPMTEGTPHGSAGLALRAERILVAQNPPQGHRATEILTYGTGTFWIDGARVAGAKGSGVWGTCQDSCRSTFNASPQNQGYRTQQHPAGRVPSNVLLIHAPHCYPLRATNVRTRRADVPQADEGRADRSQWRFRPTEATPRGYGDATGTEEVMSWMCVAECPRCGTSTLAEERPQCPTCGEPMVWGCPARRLDEQSGIRPTGAWCRHVDTAHPFGNAAGTPYVRWQEVTEEEGGAARYYFNADWGAEQAEAAYWAAQGVPPAWLRAAARELGACVICGRVGTRYHIGAVGRKEPCRHIVLPHSKPLAASRYLARLVLPPALYEPRLLNLDIGGGTEVRAGLEAGYAHVTALGASELECAVTALRLQVRNQDEEHSASREGGTPQMVDPRPTPVLVR